MQVISTYANTVVAMAESGGPYVIDAGTTLTFIGGPTGKPDTQYSWDFGDGTAATGSAVDHTYADHGIYVAVITTVVNEPGGVTTREFAHVQVRSVKPVVNAGAPSTCNEGQVVDYTASFTHVEWPETHTALFDFGDDTLPVSAPVTETNTAPMAKGTATVSHAYCESGTFVLTVYVQAKDGSIGTATRQVTVLNLPPTVTAEDIFAYPCTSLNLLAHFTDPGWCETHTATWDFGDCTPPQPAIVRETHHPPEGRGIAVATHCYDCCGSYHAVCVVTDDRGASGRRAITVRAIDVVNPGFEHGFRNRTVGAVGNGWEPYVGTAATGAAFGSGAGLFAGEEIAVHSGRRSQRISGHGAFTAGIYQQVGANLGWDYQVTTWYSLDERGTGKCRLGLDPNGGTDPTAASVVWSAGDHTKEWTQLVVRTTAAHRAVTIFLEAQGDVRGTGAYFDDVKLAPYPCPIRWPEPASAPQETCVDWSGQKDGKKLGTTYTDKGFVFSSPVQATLELVMFGVPAGQAKMLIPARGLNVGLPFTADGVVATVVQYSELELAMVALDQTGIRLRAANASNQLNVLQTIEIDQTGIASVRFGGGGGKALLVRLCAYKGNVKYGSVGDTNAAQP